MFEFLESSAGKGTLGICVTCFVFLQPLAAVWLVGSIGLAYGVHHFRESFRKLDEETLRARTDEGDEPPEWTDHQQQLNSGR